MATDTVGISPEEKDAEMRRAMAFNEAMKAEEDRLVGIRNTPGVGVRVMAPNTGSTQGRMYMGPAMTGEQESAFAAAPRGARINLMPPPTGPAPTRLEQVQMLDRPGTGTYGPDRGDRTIGIRDATPDLSAAGAQNMMRYEAMQKWRAGDRSPETMAMALGQTRGSTGAITPYQSANIENEKARIAIAKQLADARTNTPSKLGRLDELEVQSSLKRLDADESDALATLRDTSVPAELRNATATRINKIRENRKKLIDSYRPQTGGQAESAPVQPPTTESYSPTNTNEVRKIGKYTVRRK